MMVQRPSRLAALLMSPALAIIVVFMVVPIGITTLYSFLEPARYGGVIWKFSTDAYVRLLFERDIFDDTLSFSTDYIRIFVRSLVQAGVATLLCLLIGIPTAWFIATRPDRQKTLWLMLVTVPYWVNLLVRTIAMLLILRDEGPINDSLQALGLIAEPLPLSYNNFAVGLGLAYSFLPFMILPLYAAIERFDFSLLEAAYDLHANRWQAFVGVVLPILWPGVVAGSLLVFIPGIGAFLAPDILGGGKTIMIGNLIGQQFQGSRNWPFGAALSTVLMTLTLIALMWSARRTAKAGAEVV